MPTPDYEQVLQMLRAQRGENGATSEAVSEYSPATTDPIDSQRLASEYVAQQWRPGAAAPPVAPRQNPGLAAAHLAELRAGVSAMRNDGPGDVAGRELDGMRDNLIGLRSAEATPIFHRDQPEQAANPDQALAAQMSAGSGGGGNPEAAKADVAIAKMMRDGPRTAGSGTPKTVEDLEALVAELKADRKRKGRGTVSSK